MPALFSRRRGAAVVAVALVAVAALLVGGAEAKVDNALTAWTDAAQSAVRTAGIQNQLSTRVYGLVGVAANNAIKEHPTVDPVVVSAYSSHAVLSTLFPWVQTYNGLLDKQVAGKTIPDDDTLEAIRKSATDLVAAATASTGPANFKFAPNGTLWAYQAAPKQKYALYPQLGNSSPLVSSAISLTEVAFNKDSAKGPVFQPPNPRTVDYEKTFKFGNLTSPDRKQYDTDSAAFWADGANTSTIAGHWLNISLAVLPDDLSVPDTALFLARAFGAAWDASIAGWKVKYSVLQWRPVTAFAYGYPAQGKIAARPADPYWAQLLPATPAHPEYPSGHQITVGAILEVLVQTLGKDNVDFSIGTEGAPSLGERKYKSLTAAAVEVGDSRVYGGVHFPHSSEDGLKLGRLIGAQAFKNVAEPRLSGSVEVAKDKPAEGAKDKAAADNKAAVAAPVAADKKAEKRESAVVPAVAAAAAAVPAAVPAAVAPAAAAVTTKPAAVLPAAKSTAEDKAEKAQDKADKAANKAEKAAENAATKAAEAEDLGTKKAQKDADKAQDKAEVLADKAEKAQDKADKAAEKAADKSSGDKKADDKAAAGDKKGADDKAAGAKVAAGDKAGDKAKKQEKAERPVTKTTIFSIGFNKGGRKLMAA